MSTKKNEYRTCLYYLISAVIIFIGYNVWQIFQQQDPIHELIDFVKGLGFCIGLFLVIFILLPKINDAFNDVEESIRYYDQHITDRVKPIVKQRRGQEQFLTKDIVTYLADEKGYRTSDVHVGDDPSLPWEIRDPYYMPPAWQEVEKQMEEYIRNFNEEVKPKLLTAQDVQRLIDQLTLAFYEIHPFKDKNKRLAVAIGEMIAVKYGYTITNMREIRLYIQNSVVSGYKPESGVAKIEKI